MQIAVKIAKENPKAPFAAIIVDSKTGEILSRGLNNSKANPTEHGEIVAINNFAESNSITSFKNTILYTTAEPCPMCMSAIIWARIPLIVYGTSFTSLIEKGWHQIHLNSQHIIQHASSFYKGEVIGGILKEETDLLFHKN